VRCVRARAAWRTAALAALTAAVACGAPSPIAAPAPAVVAAAPPPPPMPTTPDAPFRAAPPPPLGDGGFHPPEVRAFTLANGIHVLAAHTPGPLCAMSIVFPAHRGATFAPPGAIAMLAPMLRFGAKDREAFEIGSALDEASARVATYATDETVGVDFEVASGHEDEGLAVLADMIKSPSFPARSFEWEQRNRQTAIDRPLESPGWVASRLSRAKLLGALHPYASPNEGTAAELRALKRRDVVAAYERIADPRRMRVAVAGSCDPEKLRARLERTLGDFRGHPSALAPLPPIAPIPSVPKPRQLHVVDRSKAALTHVRWSWTGVPPVATEWHAAQVAIEILYYRAWARLGQELHLTEDFDVGLAGGRAGSWPSFGGRVVTAKTPELLSEMGRLVDELAASDVSADVPAAKTRLLARHVLTFERAHGVANFLNRSALDDLGPDRPIKFEAMIRAVQAADVQAFVRRVLSSQRGDVVLVGDWSALRGPLAANGWDRAELCDAAGKTVTAVAPP
jgi:zinc protease